MLRVRRRHLRPRSNDLVTLIPDIPPSLLWLEVSALDDSSRKDSPSTDGNQGTPRYEVGYCKPPPTTRFQKGKSGNPRGRPKEAKDKMTAGAVMATPMRSARRKPVILVSPMPDKLPTPVNIGTSFQRRQLATPTDIIDVAEKSSTSNSVRACFWNSSYFSRTWKLPRSSFSRQQSH